MEVGTVDNLKVPEAFSLRGTMRRRGVGVVAKAAIGNRNIQRPQRRCRQFLQGSARANRKPTIAAHAPTDLLWAVKTF
jgi:hypothetical protein